MQGWLNVLKPKGITSQQAVSKVKRLLGTKKAGHAGTLDPLATGVLPIAVGAATKTIMFLSEADKTYEFSITFGQSRTTDDDEGEVCARTDVYPSFEDIERVLPQFRGTIIQVPPIFSAIKIKGKPAYARARKGEDIEMPAREITIRELRCTQYLGRQASFIVSCTKGTYIRSLARDIALAAGSLGFVSHLHRKTVGLFNDSNAISLDKLEEMRHNASAERLLLPLETVLDDIPVQLLTYQEVCDVKHGKPVASHYEALDTVVARYNDTAVALGRVVGSVFQPFRVFP